QLDGAADGALEGELAPLDRELLRSRVHLVHDSLELSPFEEALADLDGLLLEALGRVDRDRLLRAEEIAAVARLEVAALEHRDLQRADVAGARVLREGRTLGNRDHPQPPQQRVPADAAALGLVRDVVGRRRDRGREGRRLEGELPAEALQR